MFATVSSIVDVVSSPCNGSTCYSSAHIGVFDFDATCSFMGPPSYSTKEVWHGVGLEVQAAMTPWTGGPRTFTYPDDFVGCSVETQFGSGYPNPPPCSGLPGITCTCSPGSTVTVSDISPSSIAGSYSIDAMCDDGSTRTLTGSFETSTNCPGY